MRNILICFTLITMNSYRQESIEKNSPIFLHAIILQIIFTHSILPPYMRDLENYTEATYEQQ